MQALALRTLFVALLLTAVAAGVQAAPVVYVGVLSGAAEAMPNASPGTGLALVTVDAAANTMHVQVSFLGLQGTTVASHIHCCTATAGSGTAGVATTTPTFAGFPAGVTSGTYDSTLDMSQTSSYNPSYLTSSGGTTSSAEAALFAGIAAGTAYLNIHTSVYAAGEIRAFLIADVIFRDGLEAL